MIEAELHRPADELYATFDEEALAAASLAQVHRATLPDGREVVVKIQRPDVQTMVAADLGVMQDLAIVMEDRFELARRMDARGILEEFAAGVLIELDYRNEAYHMRRLDENMAGIEGVRVPDVDGARSARRVLTMEFIRGVKISDVAAMEAAGIDRDVVARRLPAGDHQADPGRRLLPRRPASRATCSSTRATARSSSWTSASSASWTATSGSTCST